MNDNMYGKINEINELISDIYSKLEKVRLLLDGLTCEQVENSENVPEDSHSISEAVGAKRIDDESEMETVGEIIDLDDIPSFDLNLLEEITDEGTPSTSDKEIEPVLAPAAEPESDMELEDELEGEAELELEANLESEPESDMELEDELENETELEPEPEANPEPEPESESEPEPVPKIKEKEIPIVDSFLNKYAWATDRPGSLVKDVRSAISLNDRVLFINSLFKGDAVRFQEVISLINASTDFNSLVTSLHKEFPKWNFKSEIIYRFMMAIRRKIE